MAKLLLLETATNICSVGISEEGKLLALHTATEDYAHARVITRLIEACVQESGVALADLDAVAISSGPGSFTSLRVGTATAKGICYALGKPLIAVDTLQSLAEGARSQLAGASVDCHFFSAIDARRKEVYISVFAGDMQSLVPLRAEVLDESSFQPYRDSASQLIAAGNGAPKLLELLGDDRLVDSGVRCNAVHIMKAAHLAFTNQHFVDVAYYEPLYVKPPNITQARKRL